MLWLLLIWPVVTILGWISIPILQAYHYEKYGYDWKDYKPKFKYIDCAVDVFFTMCLLWPIDLTARLVYLVTSKIGIKMARRALEKTKMAQELAVKLELKIAEAKLRTAKGS